MNTKDFIRLGVPLGQAPRLATDFVAKFILGGGNKSRLHEEVAAIVADPSAFLADELRKDFAKALLNAPPPPCAEPVKYHQWGDGLDHEAVMQMEKPNLILCVILTRTDLVNPPRWIRCEEFFEYPAGFISGFPVYPGTLAGEGECFFPCWYSD